MRKRSGAFVTFASPPCKPYSSNLVRGVPQEEKMIAEARAALQHAGGLHVMENVVGAGADMSPERVVLRGCFSGDRVDRPRLFEANFKLVVDEAISTPGMRLRRGCCLGYRRRWRRLDSFGRPEQRDCCSGCQSCDRRGGRWCRDSLGSLRGRSRRSKCLQCLYCTPGRHRG